MIPISAVKMREYERIYTGTTQELGYTNPVLGYTSDTTLQIFPTDKVTYFHYPIVAPSALLVDSDLVNSGAIGGPYPYRADKIWVKNADAGNATIWGEYPPLYQQNGVWLCAWLSGNVDDPSVPPVWKDRWYDINQISQASAMFISNAPSSVVLDIDSRIIMKAGCWYAYYHYGNAQNTSIIQTLSTLGLKMHVDTWSSKFVDESDANNTVKVLNYSGVDELHLDLNGIDQVGMVFTTSTLAVTGDMSVNMWVNVKDWNNVCGNEMLGHGYRGGWSISNHSNFLTPLIFTYDSTTGYYVFLNQNGDPVISNKLPSASAQPTSVAMGDDYFAYITENSVFSGSKHVYQLDYDGFITKEALLPVSSTLINISYSPSALFVLGAYEPSVNNQPVYHISNKTFNVTQVDYVSTNCSFIESNLDTGYTLASALFTYNNNSIYQNLSTSNTFSIDKDNNIWELEGVNIFIKKDEYQNFLLSGTVGHTTTLSARYIDFTYEYDQESEQNKTYTWIINSNEPFIYKLDSNGNQLKKVHLDSYNLFNPQGLGDFTGYQKDRKFEYLKFNKVPQLRTTLYLTSGDDIQKTTISYPTSSLVSDDWNMVTLVLDNNTSHTMKMYVNSILIDTVPVASGYHVYYNIENGIIIGSNIGRLQVLDDEFRYNTTHFKAKFDTLRLYDNVINISDVRHLYYEKFDYEDLKWNMPTSNQSYVEEIERFFKFKLPGLKSPYFNIRLTGLKIESLEIRLMIEDIIKQTIKKIVPAYAELYKIIWD